jgi:hypothetical protein
MARLNARPTENESRQRLGGFIPILFTQRLSHFHPITLKHPPCAPLLRSYDLIVEAQQTSRSCPSQKLGIE